MKLDGNAVLYQLNREFENVTCDTPLRSTMVDYPLLYDESINMSGHVVLVPEHERPQKSERLDNVICVCLGEESARVAKESGLCVVEVRDDVAFPHLYNQMQAVFVANERLDAQLRAYVDIQAGYQPLLDACAHTMGFGCMLIDNSFHVVCYSTEEGISGASHTGSLAAHGAPRITEILEGDAVDLFMASRNYKRLREGHKVFAMPGAENLFMRNVFREDQLVGALVMKHRGDVMTARYVRFLLNYLAPFVEGMYERIGTLDPSNSNPARIREALASALEGSVEASDLLKRLLLKEGMNPLTVFEILRIERSFTHEGGEELPYFAQRLERMWPQTRCVYLDGSLYAFTDIGAAAGEGVSLESALRMIRGNLPASLRENLAKAGMSRSFSDLREIPAARVQADVALAQGNESDPAFWLYRFDDYALSWLTAHGRGSIPAEYVSHPAVVSLSRYDTSHDSELLTTLATFMECRYNATLAAQKLFVARSTLINRLERIVELTHVDLDDFDERIYLELSLKMMEGEG